MAIGVQSSMATPSLAKFGSEELKQKYLVPAIAGTQVCSIAVTEAGAGSDVAGIRTKAVREGDEWVLKGSKLYITNSTQADWMCVLARTSDEGGYRGISQLIVETSSPGFSVSRKLDKLGQRSSDTAELLFEDVRVPVANVIGTEGRGFQQQMSQFVIERMLAAYGSPGSCRRALEKTRDYLKQRQAFGKPLMQNQYIAFRLAERDLCGLSVDRSNCTSSRDPSPAAACPSAVTAVCQHQVAVAHTLWAARPHRPDGTDAA
jgi:citronellyl-CoA dehydrogenase